MVTWNGCGRPAAVKAIASPSRIISRGGKRCAVSTISGTAAVTSFELRV
jgi:hypothetical protein